jgi:hypothetical protein
MANPNPQHNPTDGLGVAAVVLVSGTGVTKVGNQTATSAGTTPGGHQYALSMNIGGTPAAATCQLTTTITDVKGTTYSTVGSPVYKAYCPASAPAHPATVGSPDLVATVSGSGLITAVAKGVVIVEVQFPTYDNTEGADTTTSNPKDMIYSQIIVTVGA